MLNAVRNGRTDEVRRLIEQGAEIKAIEKKELNGGSLFAEAAAGGHLETMQYLMKIYEAISTDDKPFDVDMSNHKGQTALMLALGNGYRKNTTAAVRWLIEMGADTGYLCKNSLVPCERKTPLKCAQSARSQALKVQQSNPKSENAQTVLKRTIEHVQWIEEPKQIYKPNMFALVQQTEQLRNNLTAMQEDNNQLKDSMTKKDWFIGNQTVTINTLENKLTNQSDVIVVFHDNLIRVSQEKDRKIEELSRVQKELANLNQTKQDLQEKLIKKEQEVESCKVELKELGNNFGNVTASISELKETLDNANTIIKSFKNATELNEKLMHSYEEEKNNYELKVQQLEESLRNASQTIEELTTFDEITEVPEEDISKVELTPLQKAFGCDQESYGNQTEFHELLKKESGLNLTRCSGFTTGRIKKDLPDILENHPHLSWLDFSHNEIDDRQFNEVMFSVKERKNIRAIALEGSNFLALESSSDFNEAMSHLRQNPFLLALNLTRGQEGLKLSQHDEIQNIITRNIYGKKLSDASVSIVFPFVTRHHSTTPLFIYFPRFFGAALTSAVPYIVGFVVGISFQVISTFRFTPEQIKKYYNDNHSEIHSRIKFLVNGALILSIGGIIYMVLVPFNLTEEAIRKALIENLENKETGFLNIIPLNKLAQWLWPKATTIEFIEAEKFAFASILDLSKKSLDSFPIQVNLQRNLLQTSTMQEGQSLEHSPTFIKGGIGSHHIMSWDNKLIDLQNSQDINLIEVGKNNLILLGSSVDHLLIQDNLGKPIIFFFDTNKDCLHFYTINPFIIEFPLPSHLCIPDNYKKFPGVTVSLNGTYPVFLRDILCEELTSENIQIQTDDNLEKVREHLKGSKNELTPYDQFVELSNTFVMSVGLSALYSATPAFIVDYLKSQGLNENYAEWVGRAINCGLILWSGSYLSAGASFVTTQVCKHKLGWKEEKAVWAGNAASFAVNAIYNYTSPLGLAKTAVATVGSFCGSWAGFWVEKKIARKLNLQPEVQQPQAALVQATLNQAPIPSNN